MSRTVVCVLAGMLATILCAPAAAVGAELAPLDACYVRVGKEAQGIAISAWGFTPNSTVTLSVDRRVRKGGTAVQVSAGGTVDLPASVVPAPVAHKRPRSFEVTLTENGQPANFARARAMVAKLRVEVSPKRASPSKRVKFIGSGFMSKRPVWAHYIYRNKVRKTVRMRRPRGACGTWTARRAHLPVANPQAGAWMVQFAQQRRYRESTAHQAWMRIDVQVIPRPKRVRT